jgi:cytochrome c biogenesis protein
VFLPQDGNFLSAGVVKVPDGRPQRLAFQGLFLPTAVVAGDDSTPVSVFPDALNPALLLDVWHGPPQAETGRPESIYALDTAGLTQAKTGAGKPLRIALQPGDTYPLPNGLGTVTMDGWQRWVKLQIGDSPGIGISIAAIGFAVLGLCLSLFVRPRRVWVRLRRSEAGSSLVEVAGLDRAEARTGLTDDVAELTAELAGTGKDGG